MSMSSIHNTAPSIPSDIRRNNLQFISDHIVHEIEITAFRRVLRLKTVNVFIVANRLHNVENVDLVGFFGNSRSELPSKPVRFVKIPSFISCNRRFDESVVQLVVIGIVNQTLERR